MAFSDFKSIAEVQATFSIKASKEALIEVVEEPLTPSEWFQQEFAFNMRQFNFADSEMARCQALIFPVLREIYKAYAETYVLWICDNSTLPTLKWHGVRHLSFLFYGKSIRPTLRRMCSGLTNPLLMMKR